MVEKTTTESKKTVKIEVIIRLAKKLIILFPSPSNFFNRKTSYSQDVHFLPEAIGLG